jgi:ABC-type uncharacterized transport system substrate-binding protein
MRRRDLLLLVGVAGTSAVPLYARAQQEAPLHRIAVVHPSTPATEMSETGSRRYRAFFGRLRELGYVEGRNLVVERYSGNGQTENFAELAQEAIRDHPDLIFVVNFRIAREIRSMKDTIPVVGVGGDPVALGAVSSLARPGGNITGTTNDAGVEIIGKLLEILREIVPRATRVAWLASQQIWASPYGTALRDAAASMKIALLGPPITAPFEEPEYRRIFAAMVEGGADALIVSTQVEHVTNRRLVVDLAANYRLPAIYYYRDFTDVGGLLAYGVDPADLYRYAADQVDQVLKGARPGDIPIYQPTKFLLSVNLKTANALGIEIPNSILAQADEVVE